LKQTSHSHDQQGACRISRARRRADLEENAAVDAEWASLVLQHDDVVSGPAGKQRSDQLRGHGLVALRTRIPLQTVGEPVCVGGHRGARRGEWFSDGHSSSCGFFAALI